MSYQFRISVEERYLTALGRAAYNFAYLEWGIVWTIEKLESGYVNSVRGKTSGEIAKDFQRILSRKSIDPALTQRLSALASRFDALVEKHNGLAHANPMTAKGGEQRLYDSGKPGRRDAFEFAESDILGLANQIFHNALP